MVRTQEQRAELHREVMARRSREEREKVADIGDLPAVVNVRRKGRCRNNLAAFLTTYFPQSTGLAPFSDDHKSMISRMQQAILRGGRSVNAAYRGFAKTTISENSALWATLYGHRRCVLIAGINQPASMANIESIKRELAENDLLDEDFPEACFPIRELDNKVQRCASQTYRGVRTMIAWKAEAIRLPTIPKSVASGGMLIAKPYSKSRGVKGKRSDGANVRPDLVIVDDPQDEESAGSPLQVRKNIAILKKGIMQTASHAKTSAIIVNATPIAKNDMVEQLLTDPAWNGVRIPMVRSWSKAHQSHWLSRYAEIRCRFARDIPGDQLRAYGEATAFYRANRAVMDDGCVVSWKHCYDHDAEESAIQHAYNLLVDFGDNVFGSEYQLQPQDEITASKLNARDIADKTNGLVRGVMPLKANWVSAFIDVHDRLLYWLITAWDQDFGGAIIDYGTYPKQSIRYFSQAKAPVTTELTHPGLSEEPRLLAALEATVSTLLGRTFRREDGMEYHVGKLLIDSGWNTEVVRRFCRRHPAHWNVVCASHGLGITASMKPFSEYNAQPGAMSGLHWRSPPPSNGMRWITIDTNSWKTIASSRLLLPKGSPGSWELFGRDSHEHELLADHFVSEEPHATRGRGRDLHEWKMRPGGPDNHWWDCLIGCAVGGSILGATIPGTVARRQKRDMMSRPSLADLAKR